MQWGLWSVSQAHSCEHGGKCQPQTLGKREREREATDQQNNKHDNCERKQCLRLARLSVKNTAESSKNLILEESCFFQHVSTIKCYCNGLLIFRNSWANKESEFTYLHASLNLYDYLDTESELRRVYQCMITVINLTCLQ